KLSSAIHVGAFYSQRQKREYSNIIYGRNLTLAQEQEKIAAWAKKYNRTEQVKKFRAESDASFKQLEQRIIKVFESLPATFQEYLKILKSADKTMAEIKKIKKKKKKKKKKKSEKPYHPTKRIMVETYISPCHVAIYLVRAPSLPNEL
ncbi:hypothetical protein COOONC_23294, partial [Cooperia oncophora]